MRNETIAPAQPGFQEPPIRAAVVKGVLLLGLFIWAFKPELMIIAQSTYLGQGIYALALPLALLALILLRRATLRRSLTNGTPAGVLVVLAGIIWYAMFTWPFDYGFLRLVALPIVLAGCIAAVAGWRVLKHSLPVLMLLVMCLPLGDRLYADLIVRPETITLKVARAALALLPGVDVSLRGSDLIYGHAGIAGTIAVGESNRGMALLGAYGLIGVFVIFARIRPLWQVILAVLAAGPIMLLANFLRVLTWGVVTIYGGCSPTSEAPRDVAGTVSLLAAYVLCGGWCFILSRLVVEEEGLTETQGASEAANVRC